MTDPVQLLTSDSVEAPPQEIVLAAVRQFRYRAIVTLALGLVAVLAFALVAATRPGTGIDNKLEAMLDNPRSVVAVLEGSHIVDGVNWRVTEAVWLDGVGYLRILATETEPNRAEPEVDVEVTGVQFEGADRFEVINRGAILGRIPGAKITNGWWIRYESPAPPQGVVTVDIFMFKLSEELATQGGVSDDDNSTNASLDFVVLP